MTNKPLNRSTAIMAANLRPTRARLFLLHGRACPGDTSLRKCCLQPAWAWGLATSTNGTVDSQGVTAIEIRLAGRCRVLAGIGDHRQRRCL
jgi:hypothetical protein